jgi:hypothetical protein
MANYTGLKSNLNNALVNYSNTLANIGIPDFFKKGSQGNTGLSSAKKNTISIKPFAKARTAINTPSTFSTIKSPIETSSWNSKAFDQAFASINRLNKIDFTNYNPLKDLDNWNKGYLNASDTEKEMWKATPLVQKFINQLHPSDKKLDELWRIQAAIKYVGKDNALSMTKDEMSNKYYEHLTNNAIKEMYGSNSNINELLNLTPEAKDELLHSGYKSEAYFRHLAEDRKNDKSNYTLLERAASGASKALSRALDGTFAGMSVGSLIGAPVAGAGAIPGAVIGAVSGALVGVEQGFAEGFTHPEDDDAYSLLGKDKEDNDALLNKILVNDNKRIKEKESKNINAVSANIYESYRNGKISAEEIDKAFDDLALNNDQKVYTDELGRKRKINYTGSNYYTAFKGTDELSNFTTADKIRALAQAQVIGAKYGQGRVLNVLDTDMQDYANENQTKLEWAGHTLKKATLGGVANIMSKAAGMNAIYAEAVGGKQGLADYLEGKGNYNFIDANYWNKVDQYNLNPLTATNEDIAKIDKAGGISPYNNVVKAGTENDFWTANNALEAVAMSKYAWSDYLTNVTLAKILGGAVRIAGGVKLPSGVLASESTMLSKAVNTVGNVGIVGFSTAGIAEAYGLQTYNETLEKANKKLDDKINLDVEKEIEKIANDPNEQLKLHKAAAAENARRKAKAGERGNWIPVDEDKLWQDHLDYQRDQIRKQLEKTHSEDRLQARKDAATAYMVDASIEGLRMSGVNTLFKSYLFDKGTLAALRLNNPYVDATTKNGLYTASKHAVRNKVLKTVADNVWGGFYSNYMDDVTVGAAEAYGLQSYNNYLYDKYNPVAYASVLDNYASPLVAAVAGAKNAAMSKRAFIDGGVGALGTFFTFIPHPFTGKANWNNIQKQAKEFNEAEEVRYQEAKKQGKEYKKKTFTPHWSEMASAIVTNPILSAIADAKAASRMTEAEIDRVNGIMKENEYAFNNMTETLSAQNKRDITRQGTSMIEAEDAKDRAAFTLAANLNTMRNSSVVTNTAEGDKAAWTKKNNFAGKIARAINSLLGVSLFIEDASTPYLKAMRDLNAASTIGDRNVDEQTAQRQQELISTFKSLNENKSLMEGKTEEEQNAIAAERLKENADDLLSMMDSMNKVQQKFEKSLSAQQDPDIAQQLMYNYVLGDRQRIRYKLLESRITGEYADVDDIDSFIKGKGYKYSNDHLLAKYGSKAGYDREVASQEKTVAEAQKAYDDSKKIADKYNPNQSVQQNAENKVIYQMLVRRAKEKLDREKAVLEEMKREEYFVKTLFNANETENKEVEAAPKETPVIEALDILKLDADDRYRMLDDYHKNDYSKEQQEEIEKAKEILTQRRGNLISALQEVKDAAVLKHRISDNMAAAKRIMKNPSAAKILAKRLRKNRVSSIIRYFNDKVVSEKFDNIVNDTEALKDADNAYKALQKESTAIIRGLLSRVSKELKGDLYSQKSLDILKDGLEKVLKEREERSKENSRLQEFINNVKKVNHTETFLRFTGNYIEDESGNIQYETSNEQRTSEVELSDNDRLLLNYAMGFAIDNNISLSEVGSDKWVDSFSSYVQERDHAAKYSNISGEAVNATTIEESSNPVTSEYVKSLISDVMKAYGEHKQEVEQETKPKETSSTPKSTTTIPKDPTPKSSPKNDSPEEKKEKKKNDKEEERRGDEVKDTKNPFGLPSKKSTPKENNKDKGKDKKTHDSSDEENKTLTVNDVLKNCKDGANKDLAVGVKAILDIVEDAVKKAIASNKNELLQAALKVIDEVVQNNTYTNINDLKQDVVTELLMNNALTGIANVLSQTDLEDVKEPEKDKDKKKSGNKKVTKSLFSTMTATRLSTIDLGSILNSGKDSSSPVHYLYEYVMKYAVPKVLEKLGKGLQENKYRQAQVVFLYDSTLAAQAKEKMGSNYNAELNCPIIMAIEVNEAKGTNEIVSEDGEVITIKNGTKEEKYVPIGIMPATDNQGTEGASWMENIRSLVDFSKEGVSLIRQRGSKGKNNGSAIKTNIATIEVNTEEGNYPEANKETPRRGVIELMDENYSSPSESLIGECTPQEKSAYEEAKKSGNPIKLRQTSIYKKLRKAFIDRLSKELTSNKRYGLFYTLTKGSRDIFKKSVIPIADISKLSSKVDGRSITDILKEVREDSNDSAVEELLKSNSRLERFAYSIYSAIKELNNDNTDKIEDKLKNAIKYNFDISTYSVTVTENSKTSYTLTVSEGEETLAELTISKEESRDTSDTAAARFLANLILDDENNVRKNEFGFDNVKVQISYEDAKLANSKEENSRNKNARRALEDLYDDGVFQMQVSKMAYSPTRVVVYINNAMKQVADTPTPPAPTNTATDNTNTVQAKGGQKIDPNTGAVLEKGKEKKGKGEGNSVSGDVITLPEDVQNKVNSIVQDAKEATLTDDKKHYSIKDKLYARVTSIKSAIKGKLTTFSSRFNEKNAWGRPSTSIGNTFDAFARDVFNRVFSKMNTEETESRLDTYGNSTKENYNECLNALNKIVVAAASQGRMFIATGDKDNPGSIVASGQLKVKGNDEKGNDFEKLVNVAGTVDALAVDAQGNFYIYDFKTHRNDKFDAEHAKEKGYDKQLSMYAKFLEDKYGIKVSGIYVIPVKVNYDTPIGEDGEGNQIRNGKVYYENNSPINPDQLYTKADKDAEATLFTGADYKVGEVFELERLNNDELNVSYEQMNDAEKQAIEEAVKEQGEEKGNDNQQTDNMEVKKVEVESTEEEEFFISDHVYNEEIEARKKWEAMIRAKYCKRKKRTPRNVLENLDPEHTVEKDVENKSKECGSPKPKG